MAEYIEREAANIAIQKKMQEYINKSVQPLGFGKYREDDLFTNAALGCRAALEEVKAIPTADVREAKRGRIEEDENTYLWCSECGCNITLASYEMPNGNLILRPNFCPSCGADMREEQT